LDTAPASPTASGPSGPPPSSPPGAGAGLAAGISAFLLWGLFPVYWKLFVGLPPLELIAHRITWTMVFLLIVVPLRGRWGDYLRALRTPRQLGLYAISGTLLAVNWLTFVYAVLTDRILDASLGYFLTPLVNVLLGMVVLRERLRPMQWAAIGLATSGVLVQIAQLGRLPWIALVLAATFGIYGLLRKRGALGSLTGLAVETTVLTPIALGFIGFLQLGGGTVIPSAPWGEQMVLALSGVVTATPLLLFATAARSLRLATVGLLQYIGPTVQFVIGVVVYAEPFTGPVVASFILIWIGLALYTVDGLHHGYRHQQSARRQPVPGPGGQT